MNYEQERLAYDEIEISVSHLIKSCIKQIKWIVIIAVAFAIAIPRLIYVKDVKAYDASIQSIESINLTGAQTKNVDKYFYLEKNLQNFEDYVENSPIMNIDFANVYQGELQYHIKADSNLKADIATVIANYFVGQAFIEEFCEEIEGLDATYAKELFEPEIIDVNNGIVSIQVIAASEEECSTYIACIKELFLAKSEELKQSIGTHEVDLIQENISSGYSYRVYETQNIARNNLQNTEKLLSSHISNLSEIEKVAIIEVDNTNTSLTVEVVKEPTFSIVFVIVGLLLGMIVGIIIVVLGTLFKSRLQTEKELAKRFDIAHIGTVVDNVNKKAETLAITTSTMRKFVESKNIGQIAMISTNDSINRDSMKALYTMLEADAIHCSMLQNILKEKDAIDKLSNDTPVVLLETIGKTKVKEVYEEVSLCKNLGIEVVGYICITE